MNQLQNAANAQNQKLGHSVDTVKGKHNNRNQIVVDRQGLGVFENSMKNKNLEETPYFDDYQVPYSSDKVDIINKIIQQKKEIKILEAIVTQRQQRIRSQVQHGGPMKSDNDSGENNKNNFNFIKAMEKQRPNQQQEKTLDKAVNNTNSSFAINNKQK